MAGRGGQLEGEKHIMERDTKTGHTPGPWHAYNASGGRVHKKWRIRRTGARNVAEICENNSPEIEHANANLISAAPELLEALEACLRDCDSREQIHPKSRITLSMATQQAARAAIAKAKGGVR